MEVYTVAVHLGQFVYNIDCVGEDCTCGWLLSEVMRRYMHSNDGADPGLLGLKILEDDRDLDLGADVVDAVHVGETVVGVSYTLKAPKVAKVDAKADQSLRATRARDAGLRMEGDLDLAHDDDALGGTKSMKAETRNALFNPSHGTNARKLFGADVCVPFTPLASLERQISTLEEQKSRIVDRVRVVLDTTIRFAMKTVRDPTSALPLITVLTLGPTRLGIVEPVETEFVYDFQYEDIIGWGDTGQFFFVEIELELDEYDEAEDHPSGKKLCRFEFEVGGGKTPADVLQILYTRCAKIANQRRVQSRAKAKMEKMAPKGGGVDARTGEVTDDVKVQVFTARRMKDPTGMLPLLCELQVGSQGVAVLDVHTRDVIFDWSYTMIFAWRVDHGEILVAVMSASGEQRLTFRTPLSWHIKIAIEENVNEILRFNGQPLLAVGEDIPADVVATVKRARSAAKAEAGRVAKEDARREDMEAIKQATVDAKAEIKRVAKEKKEATAAAAVEAAAVEAPTADLLDFGDFEAAPTLPPPSAP